MLEQAFSYYADDLNAAYDSVDNSDDKKIYDARCIIDELHFKSQALLCECIDSLHEIDK